MSTFYRVHAYIDSAPPGESGHPLYVHPGRTDNRIDNPDRYTAIYLADTAAGAIAEVFANHHTWTPDLLAPPPFLAGSVRAISRFEGDLNVMHLNDPSQLLAIGQRPSRIVTRHRSLTQAWSLDVFENHSVQGVSWWSYHDPDWMSLGVWDYSALAVLDTTPLTPSTPGFTEARVILGRSWATSA